MYVYATVQKLHHYTRTHERELQTYQDRDFPNRDSEELVDVLECEAAIGSVPR